MPSFFDNSGCCDVVIINNLLDNVCDEIEVNIHNNNKLMKRIRTVKV